jgi:hypothetical protein
MRLDAREAVGDCLFLRLLERERVVQRAGKKIGERAQQENFFIREFTLLRRLHIQNAQQVLGVRHRQRDR